MYAGRTNSIVKMGGTTPTQTKEVKATSFPTVVSPDSGYALSQATVSAPDNLTAENIKSGVSIAGVTGTYEGSGGSEGLDARSEFLLRLFQNNGIRYSNGVRQPLNLLKEYWPDILPKQQSGQYWDGLVMTNYCFANCSFDTVELPEGKATSSGVTQLSDFIFYKSGAVNDEGGMLVTGGSNEIYSFGESSFDSARLRDIPNIKYTDNTIQAKLFKNAIFKTCNVPEGITTIDYNALYNITVSDGKVTLPTTLTSMSGGYVVSGTYSTEIDLVLKSTTPPTMDNSSGIYKIKTITVPAGSLEAYQTATNWSKFADIMVEATTETTEAGA